MFSKHRFIIMLIRFRQNEISNIYHKTYVLVQVMHGTTVSREKSRLARGPNRKMLWYKLKSSNSFSVIYWIWILCTWFKSILFFQPREKVVLTGPKSWAIPWLPWPTAANFHLATKMEHWFCKTKRVIGQTIILR